MIEFSKNQVNHYVVTEKDEEQRLDNLLIKLLKDVPKTHIYRIIRSKEVKVNNKKSDVSYKVQINDVVRIPPIVSTPKQDKAKFVPSVEFPIVFEDDDILVINKPSGVACHGGSGVSFGVIEQLRQSRVKAKFLELVHRLDRDTSGLLVLAKKRRVLVDIQDQMRNGSVRKYYLALSNGIWVDNIRNVKAPLYKYVTQSGERRVRVDNELGQYSNTIFSIVKKYQNVTLVQAELKTGRTHQIRVHLQSLGMPIIGDDKYGEFDINREYTKQGLKRMFLHAERIEFIHPTTRDKLKLTAPLPKELTNFLASLN